MILTRRTRLSIVEAAFSSTYLQTNYNYHVILPLSLAWMPKESGDSHAPIEQGCWIDSSLCWHWGSVQDFGPMCFIKNFRHFMTPFFHVLRPSKTTGREPEASWGQLAEHMSYGVCTWAQGTNEAIPPFAEEMGHVCWPRWRGEIGDGGESSEPPLCLHESIFWFRWIRSLQNPYWRRWLSCLWWCW